MALAELLADPRFDVGTPEPALAAIRRKPCGGAPSRPSAASPRCVGMYPRVRQRDARRRAYPSAEVRTRPAGPPRYKLAVLTWAGAYGVITLLLALLGPVIASWPLVLRTLLLSVTMVVALTWVIMPRLTRLFGGWLHAQS
jgi:hypothetical protein